MRLAVLASLLLAAPAWAIPLDHLNTTDDIGLNKIPNRGTSHVLVIAMRVGQPRIDAGEWRAIQTEYANAGGPGSFRDYWRTVSGGRYDPVPVLADPVIYTDRCPIPGKTLANCRVDISDVGLLFNQALSTAISDVLGRVRDEQMMDLGMFDVNGADGTPDGFFDAVVIDSNIYQGIAPPLAALNNAVAVHTKPGNTGDILRMGTIALVPPGRHEYGHLFGFIDLYGGPTVNDLMEDRDSTLAAFSRQQIGWGEVREITGPTTLSLPPVLDTQLVLRVGQRPRYLMIENRGGAKHAGLEACHPGVYVYSVDETTLPTTQLGFIDVPTRTLYLPNAASPYLDVALPVGCAIGDDRDEGTCAVLPGQRRALIHASGEDTGLELVVGAKAADGTVEIEIRGPEVPDAGVVEALDAGASADAAEVVPPMGSAERDGCTAGGPGAFAILVLALFRRRR